MLAGRRIYVDFFQYTLPGTEYFYLLFFKIWGVRAWIPSAVLLLTGLAWFAMSAAICRRLLPGWSVFLPGTFSLILLLAMPDATHHKLSITLELAAVTVMIERRSPAPGALHPPIYGRGLHQRQSLVFSPHSGHLFLPASYRSKFNSGNGFCVRKT